MVKVKFTRRPCDIDAKLNDIRDRLDGYGFGRAVEQVSSSTSQETKHDHKPSPLALAKKTNITEAKIKAMNRREIPPHLDRKTNSVVYPPFTLTFGVRGPTWKNRKQLRQYGPDNSRFGIERPPLTVSTREPAFLLGNDDYGFLDAFSKTPRPRKGYQTLAALSKSWNDSERWSTPALGSYSADPTILPQVASYPKQSPFSTSGERFPKVNLENETPGPAFYDIRGVKIGRRVLAQHRLGHGATLPPPFHIHCSHKKDEKCHTCKTEVFCLPSYYTIPGKKLFLCPLCYLVERKMAITLKPQTISKFKRVMDCSTIHTHFPDSDRVLTHATLDEVKWLAKKEHYMHLHFPKERDAIPQTGVWRYAAP